MSFLDFLYQKDAAIARALLNRPAKLNAFRHQTCQELLAILDDFSNDDSVRVLLLRGTGRAFSAGVDLSAFDVFDEEGQLDEKKAREQLDQYQAITQKLINCKKPVIAAVNGLAIGLGIEIALACDIRIASEDARFAFAESRRGLFQTNGVMYFLPRMIGYGRAKELMMTGRTIDAARAAAIGMVSKTVSTADFDASVEEYLTQLTANAPISLKLIKQVARDALSASLTEVLEMETEGMMDCLRSADLQEGLQAFEEKRPPIYKGI